MVESILSELEKKYSLEVERLSVELEKINNSSDLEISSHLEHFIARYERNGEIDFELLEKFITKLNVEDIGYYKDLLEYRRSLGNDESNPIFGYDVREINNAIKSLIQKINSYRFSVNKSIQNNGFKKRQYAEEIENRKRFISCISSIKNGDMISQDDFSLLLKLIKEEEKYSDEEKLSIVEFLTKYNVEKSKEIINKKVNIEKKKQVEKKRKAIEKKEKKKEKSSVIINEEIVPSSNIQDEYYIDSSILTEEEKELLRKAEKVKGFLEEVDEIPLSAQKIKLNSNINDRLLLYNTPALESDKKTVLAYDIVNNLLPELKKSILSGEKNNELFNILDNALRLYENIVKKETLKDIIDREFDDNYKKFLRDNDLNKELDIISKLNVLLSQFESTNNEFKARNEGVFEQAKNMKKEFFDALKEFLVDRSPQDKELVDEYYGDLEKIVKKIEGLFKELQDKKEQERWKSLGKDMIEQANPLHNMIVFVNDDPVLSSVEENITNSRLFPSDPTSLALKGLRSMLSTDLITSKDHKAKTQRYDESFLDKYMVRSFGVADYRIFYSKFECKNFAINGVNPELVIVHSIGYGATDGNSKNDIYEGALDTCFANKDKIDHIVELFNKENLTDEEKEEIEKFIETQHIKFGHFIETVQSKREKKKTGKPKGGRK